MDARRFDDLILSVATGVNRRRLLRGMGGVLGLAIAARRSAAGAEQQKRALCHWTGDPANPWTVIDVAEPAWQTHLDHGDGPYVDCCTDGDCEQGSVCCDGQCTVTPFSCGATVCGPDEWCNSDLGECFPSQSCFAAYNNCSGMGACIPQDGTCLCTVIGASGDDCSTYVPLPGMPGCAGFDDSGTCCARFDSDERCIPYCYNDGIYCSGHGVCNLETDTCVCDPGFDGVACEQVHICPA